MSGVIYTNQEIITGKVQGDGAQTVILSETAKLAIEHQATAVRGTATQGTLAVLVKAAGGNLFEPLINQYGAAVVIDLAAPRSLVCKVKIDAWQFVPTGVNGTYGVALAGWQ